MKFMKNILILSIAAITAVMLASCSRSSMRSAGDAMKNTTRRAENFVENGIDAVTGRGSYGANNGYSGNTATGTGTLPYDGYASPIMPTIRDKSTSNRGQINTNRGSLDGGMDSNRRAGTR